MQCSFEKAVVLCEKSSRKKQCYRLLEKLNHQFGGISKNVTTISTIADQINLLPKRSDWAALTSQYDRVFTVVAVEKIASVSKTDQSTIASDDRLKHNSVLSPKTTKALDPVEIQAVRSNELIKAIFGLLDQIKYRVASVADTVAVWF